MADAGCHAISAAKCDTHMRACVPCDKDMQCAVGDTGDNTRCDVATGTCREPHPLNMRGGGGGGGGAPACTGVSIDGVAAECGARFRSPPQAQAQWLV